MVEMLPSVGDRHGQRGIQVIVVRSVSGDDVARPCGQCGPAGGPRGPGSAGQAGRQAHRLGIELSRDGR